MPLVRHVATMGGGSGGRLPFHSASSRNKSSGSSRVTLVIVAVFAAFGFWAWSSYVSRIQAAIRRGAEEAEAVEVVSRERLSPLPLTQHSLLLLP